MGVTVQTKKLQRLILLKDSSVDWISTHEITVLILSSCREMAQKQSNAEYVQVPNEESIPPTTVPSSNATNEYPSVDETAASGTPENHEKQEVEKEEIA